ncbi:MAG: glycoside hydrolase family 26 protein, partial [Candidatus Methanofastidiosia archaeon]
MNEEEDEITPEGLSSYERMVEKSATWVYFSHNWYKGRSFPIKTATWIRNTGSIPFIRLMLRSSEEQNISEPTFTLDRIINGEFDVDLHSWAQAARVFASPLIVEYGTEVNGEWFSWNGIWNGGGTLDGYGDPTLADGPEKFRDAYRHIIRIMREEGAYNIIWVFHVNNKDYPDEPWNRLEQYYPGDEWVDWIGVSVYGAQTPMDEEYPQFRENMDEVYPRLVLLSKSKPIVILEFGVTTGHPNVDQAAWANRALEDITTFRWSRIIGFSWWNEAWENDDNPIHNTNMRVQDNPNLVKVFKRLVGMQDNVL